jgi:hypothetical protein
MNRIHHVAVMLAGLAAAVVVLGFSAAAPPPWRSFSTGHAPPGGT